ncbi:unnamed protein product, partial [Mesorhabditis spiculigera]
MVLESFETLGNAHNANANCVVSSETFGNAHNAIADRVVSSRRSECSQRHCRPRGVIETFGNAHNAIADCVVSSTRSAMLTTPLPTVWCHRDVRKCSQRHCRLCRSHDTFGNAHNAIADCVRCHRDVLEMLTTPLPTVEVSTKHVSNTTQRHCRLCARHRDVRKCSQRHCRRVASANIARQCSQRHCRLCGVIETFGNAHKHADKAEHTTPLPTVWRHRDVRKCSQTPLPTVWCHRHARKCSQRHCRLCGIIETFGNAH